MGLGLEGTRRDVTAEREVDGAVGFGGFGEVEDEMRIGPGWGRGERPR